MFRLNTNIDKKERSVVSMRDFKGLDTVHSPMNISYQHAIDMRNLINRNGVNRKREGWRQEHAFDKTATPAGTWSGKLDFSENADGADIQEVVIHFSYLMTGLSISAYKVSDSSNISVTNNYAILVPSTNEIRAIYFETVENGITKGKIYAVGAGKLLIIEPVKNAGNYGLNVMDLDYITQNHPENYYIPNSVILGALTYYLSNIWWYQDNSSPYPFNIFTSLAADAFSVDDYYYPDANYPNGEDTASTRLDNLIPITEKGYTYLEPGEGNGNYTIEENSVGEKINVLTPNTKNTAQIFITDEDRQLNDSGSKKIKIKVFRADEMEGYSYLHWETATSGDYYQERNEYFQHRNDYYSKIIVTISANGEQLKKFTGFTPSAQLTSAGNRDIFVPANGDQTWNICFCGKNLCIDIGKLVSLSGNTVNDIPVGITKFDVEISFPRRTNTVSQKIQSKLQQANMLTLFGAEGNPNRLFLCDGSNTILYSEYRNPLYIGAQNTIVLGSTPITGWIKGTETSLYVFKQYSRQEENLYVLNGELITSEENSYGVDEGEVVFRNKGYALPESAVNQDAVCSLANDVLIVSDDGVYGITLSANVASTERFARSRAEQIKNLLQEQDLTKAKCIVWDNKMFLSVGGFVFVADARFRASFDGDMADTFNYEWWLWDNIPVKYWVVIQDKLCFVTDDNRLCAFYDGFSDYVYDDLLVAVIDGSNVTISNQYAEYNKIALNAAYRLCIDSADITNIVDGALVINTERLYTVINEGDTVYFDVTAGALTGYPVTANTPYTVESIDIMSGQAKFSTTDGTAVVFAAAMAPLLASNPLRISKAANNEYDMNIDTSVAAGNTQITDADGNVVKLVEYNGVSSYSATIFKKYPVKAYWQTGSYDFGSSMYSKTMERFSVAFDRESPKKLKLYYTTAWNGGDRLFKDLKKNADFDFDAFSFLLFTFDKRFETSYTRRLLIRNFNYIAFRLLSDDAEDFSVDSMSFVYKVNKLNRGEH